MSSALTTRLSALCCAGVVAVAAAGCGSSATPAGAPDVRLSMGTTNVTSVLDPAGAYDMGSWTVLSNTHQTLLAFPAGGTVPVPDAAKTCGFGEGDFTTYTCTLKSGLTFSNGHALTAEDVVYSFTRMKEINDPNGPYESLFGVISSVKALGDKVVFHLSEPDAVFPSKVATAAGSIVDAEVYPADRLLPNGELVGSGPYELTEYKDEPRKDGEGVTPRTVGLTASASYKGDAERHNSGFTTRFYDTPEELKNALDAGDVDIADSGLDPKAYNAYRKAELTGDETFKTVGGDGLQVRYLIFNTKDRSAGNLAVRRAVSQVIDRKALARDAYDRTVEALYSVVPRGVLGSTTAFYDRYGDPDPAAARRTLRNAGVPVPVKLDITWSRAAAGQAEGDTLKEQLERSGLFTVAVHHEKDFGSFQKGWKDGRYQAYTAGWYPDYPDADNFIGPLVVKGGVFHNGWDDAGISGTLVPQTRRQADRLAAADPFDAAQRTVAEQVPMLPLWQGKLYYVTKSDVTGVETTIDASGVFRFWLVGRR